MAHRHVSVYLAAASALLVALVPALPDGDVGSPRSIVTALSVGLLGASVVLRGGYAASPEGPSE